MFQQYLDGVMSKLITVRDAAAEMTPNVIMAVVFLVLVGLAARLVKKVVGSILRRSASHQNLSKVLSRMASVTINLVGVMVAASIVFPSVTPASIFSLLGVGGVAIGFAFKDVFQNFLAGILILLLKSFEIGDQIEFEGFEGTVEDIEIRATVIRTYDNRKVIVPNSSLFTNRVIVNTAFDKRRISVLLGIGYGDDVVLAKRIILKTIADVEGVLPDPAPYVLIVGYGGSSVDLEVRFWLTPPRRRDVLEMRDAILEVIKPALFGAGIDLPYPTRQILFHDQTEATDGDRSRQREGWPSRGDRDPRSKFDATRTTDRSNIPTKP